MDEIINEEIVLIKRRGYYRAEYVDIESLVRYVENVLGKVLEFREYFFIELFSFNIFYSIVGYFYILFFNFVYNWMI